MPDWLSHSQGKLCFVGVIIGISHEDLFAALPRVFCASKVLSTFTTLIAISGRRSGRRHGVRTQRGDADGDIKRIHFEMRMMRGTQDDV